MQLIFQRIPAFAGEGELILLHIKGQNINFVYEHKFLFLVSFPPKTNI